MLFFIFVLLFFDEYYSPLQIKEFIALYTHEGWVGALAEQLQAGASKHIQVKGLVGSLGAVLAAAIYKRTAATQLFILHDKEEAAYFYSDLCNLLDKNTVLLYPASQNRPYAPEATNHADQLMRVEVLHRICHPSTQGILVVTYPAALSEKGDP